MTRELNRVALHTTNLENILGDPIGESASIWTAVSALTTKVSDNSIDSAGRFAAINVEFEEMFGALPMFQEHFQKRFQKLEHRVNEVELGGDNTSLYKAMKTYRSSYQKRTKCKTLQLFSAKRNMYIFCLHIKLLVLIISSAVSSIGPISRSNNVSNVSNEMPLDVGLESINVAAHPTLAIKPIIL